MVPSGRALLATSVLVRLTRQRPLRTILQPSVRGEVDVGGSHTPRRGMGRIMAFNTWRASTTHHQAEASLDSVLSKWHVAKMDDPVCMTIAMQTPISIGIARISPTCTPASFKHLSRISRILFVALVNTNYVQTLEAPRVSLQRSCQ